MATPAFEILLEKNFIDTRVLISDSTSTKKSSVERSRVAECRVRAVSSTADYLSSRVESSTWWYSSTRRVIGCVICPEIAKKKSNKPKNHFSPKARGTRTNTVNS